MARRAPAGFRLSSHPSSDPAPEAEERLLSELAAEGMIALGDGKLTPFMPLRIPGKSLAETLLEDRNDRF